MRISKSLVLIALAAVSMLGCDYTDTDDGDDHDDNEADDDAGSDDDTADDDTDDDAGGSFSHQVFMHSFPDALHNISTGDFEKPAFEYPAIAVEAKFQHALSFQMTPLLPPTMKASPSHGPLVLYADDGEAIVFAPLDGFFESVITFKKGKIRYGVAGEIDAIPAGWEHPFVMARGHGINATIEYWGDVLREHHGKERADRYADIGLSYLGYWTDNGAYYYYNTAPGMNEADTLLAVKADADARDIPFGYLQLDSWWYFKDDGALTRGGLTLWEPIPEMFPDGLTAFQEAMGWPLVLHNRWFAKNTDYKNDYPFYDDEEMAFPLTRDVFDEFMANASSWGAITYEQDWLMSQYWGVTPLRAEVGRAAEWMGWMDDAAADAGLTTQWCMAGPGHLMDVVHRRTTTTARTSIDYRRDVSKESYWPQYHIVAMIADAVGVRPFKDNFRSTEKHAEAEALISALSTGMVAPSDKIGASKRDIIMRTCRADGLLLKPDKPATPIDAMFFAHSRPFITATYSDRGALGRWRYVASYHLAREHPQRTVLDRVWPYVSYGFQDAGTMFVFPDLVTDWHLDIERDLGVDGPAVVYDWREQSARVVEDYTMLTRRSDLYDYNLDVVAPIFANGLSLIGEADKYVTLADKRFSDIAPTADGIDLTLAGEPGEMVSITVYDAEAEAFLPEATATIGADGTATLSVNR